MKGSGTLYVIFRCCWLHTIHAWLVLLESSISWVMWVWEINVRFHNVFHNLIFNKPTCVMCYTIHNGGHYLLEHLHMFVLLKFYIICNSMFGVLSCHNFLTLFNCLLSPPHSLTMFPIWPFLDFNSQGTVYMLSLNVLPPSFQPIFPFYPHPMSFEPKELMIFDTYISLLDFYDNTNVLFKVSFMEYAWSKDIGTFGTNWRTKLGKLRID